MVGSFGEVYILDWEIAVADFDLPQFQAHWWNSFLHRNRNVGGRSI